MAKTTVYAVRDAETKERLTYRYRSQKDAIAAMRSLEHTGKVMEVYRTSQDLPAAGKPRKI